MGSSAVVVIQARLNSSRLDGKILAEIEDASGKKRPLLQYVIDRARAIPGIVDNQVVVAVPDEPTRQFVARATTGAIVFAPKDTIKPNNVLGRYAAVCEQWPSHDIVVRLTGDNPLIDPAEAASVLADLRGGAKDYASNLKDGMYNGTDVEAFTAKAVMDANNKPQPADYREHVTPPLGQPKVRKYHELRLTVDTAEDLERVRAIYKRLPLNDYSLAATLKAAKGL